MNNKNPKILHRIYFDNFKPFRDPFEHYLESWAREMPDYKIMRWNASNLDVNANVWTKTAAEQGAPVFLSEYFRWAVLAKYGGVYLDADCEIVDGRILSRIIDEMYEQDDYDTFFGVEERSNGHPTAQTIGAKQGSELVLFMKGLYERSLGDFWPWREKRGLIGPQLMSLFFLNKGINVADDGFIKNIDAPVVLDKSKVYPQTYFSPKFSILGDELDYQQGKTCVYHMFANSNLDFSARKRAKEAQEKAATFSEYRQALEKSLRYPRYFDASWLETRIGTLTDHGLRADSPNGVLCYGPYISMPKGDYKVRLHLANTPRSGWISVNVTAEGGAVNLASKRVNFPQRRNEIEVSFSIEQLNAHKLEVVVEVGDANQIVLQGIEFDKTTTLKILHRIYFGFDGKPDQFSRYLKTWTQQLPDYKIMHWDATNLPMDINDYVKNLHAVKDHAFLTDYFRWYVLREYGGTYLDADVEVYNGERFRKVIDDLEISTTYDACIGIDQREGGWYTAHTMSSKPGSDLATFMCDVYENFGSFTAWRKKGFYFWAPQLTALFFANRGHNTDGMGTTPHLEHPTNIARVQVYPQDYFSPLAPTGKPDLPFALEALTANTSLCHHFACSWHDPESIYLDHSEKKGGQANILLDEIVNAGKRQPPMQRHYTAANGLESVAGWVTSDAIHTTGTAGCLVYGPYADLLPGEHAITFKLDEIRSLKGLSCDITADNGDRHIEQIADLARYVDDNHVRIEFATEQALKSVEFRLFVGKRASFKVTEVVHVARSV